MIYLQICNEGSEEENLVQYFEQKHAEREIKAL